MFLVESANNTNIVPMIIWIGIFIVALIIEITTQELVSIWFSFGAIPPLIMAAFNIDVTYQILVYAIVSAIFFVLSELLIKKRLKPRNSATNADSLIGEKILVLKSVKPMEKGEGKVRDVVWTIKSDDEIQEGQYAIIKEIKGNTLIVAEKGDK